MHIGAPKSGTSYLQDRFQLNRESLAQQGLSYLPSYSGSHFEAAIDLTQNRWAGAIEGARGQWQALVATANRTRGDVLISHETFAAATPEQIARARASFADDELHVIYSQRDLGRQLPAEWQEMVKHRSGLRFAGFMNHVRKADPADSDFWFWRVQSLPDVLTRWSAGLPRQHVHLVTVPGPGGSKTALWDRFCSVVGLDPDADYDDSGVANVSLGTAEVAALRRLNLILRERKVSRDTYVDLVRELVVRQALAERESERAHVPRHLHGYVEDITAGWLEWIATSGIDVVGDPADLEPQWTHGLLTDPDNPDPAEIADAAIAALAAVLVELDRDRGAPRPLRTRVKRVLGRFRRRGRQR